ncbi:unnamed protein product [Owenia fusiformis]|uniref:Uncharacterized protein n=1 Tax=Owenia fusiformis TaxID=6347 RepID=A0A8S4NRQ4_OWEFU|nr:unnamed protein product [Owenia fusiformis]
MPQGLNLAATVVTGHPMTVKSSPIRHQPWAFYAPAKIIKPNSRQSSRPPRPDNPKHEPKKIKISYMDMSNLIDRLSRPTVASSHRYAHPKKMADNCYMQKDQYMWHRMDIHKDHYKYLWGGNGNVKTTVAK